jgi:AraC-like DNA-binding protein
MSAATLLYITFLLCSVVVFLASAVIVAFNRERKIYVYALAASMAILSWYCIVYVFCRQGFIIHMPFVLRLGMPFYYLVPVGGLIYIRGAVLGKENVSRKDIFHLIPFFIALPDLCWYYYKDYHFIAQYVQDINRDFANIFHLGAGFIPAEFHFVFRPLHGLVYAAVIWRILYACYLQGSLRDMPIFKRTWILFFAVSIFTLYGAGTYMTLVGYIDSMQEGRLNIPMLPGPMVIMCGVAVLFSIVIFFFPSILYGAAWVSPSGRLVMGALPDDDVEEVSAVGGRSSDRMPLKATPAHASGPNTPWSGYLRGPGYPETARATKVPPGAEDLASTENSAPAHARKESDASRAGNPALPGSAETAGIRPESAQVAGPAAHAPIGKATFAQSSPSKPASQQSVADPVRTQAPLLPPEKVAAYATEISRLMEEEHFYKAPALTLADLATALDIHPRYLTYVLGRHYNMRFTDFINGYRIRFILSQFEAGALRTYTIEAMAEEAGFTSRTTFFNAFKKVTGMNPSDYIKSNYFSEMSEK